MTLLVSACSFDPNQLAGTALGDSIFLPIINNATDNTAQADLAQNNPTPSDTAPEEGTQDGDIIPGQYIVVLSDEMVTASSVSAIAAEMTAQYGGEVIASYGAALNGFAATFPAETSQTAVTDLEQDPRVPPQRRHGRS